VSFGLAFCGWCIVHNGLGYDFVADSAANKPEAFRAEKYAAEISRLFCVSVFKVSNSFRFLTFN
jgi:hypothetical protein